MRLFLYTLMNFPDNQQQDSLYALVVAGGSGNRMQSSTPKQFILIGGKPVLLHTLEAFHHYDPSIQIILVLPTAEKGRWKELRQEYQCQVPHAIVEGGESRFQSVKNGLALVPPEAVVAIHDGVRPFVNPEMLREGFATALEKGSAIATVPLKESIRELLPEGSKAKDRSQFLMVQTPQTFKAGIIKKAYRQAESPQFTDCASVAEADGNKVHMIAGSYQNIKITTPEDLLLAENILKRKKL